MKKPLIIFLILTGLTLFYFWAALTNYSVIPEQSANINNKITVSQKISVDKNAKSFEKYQIDAGKTDLDLLKQSESIQTKGEKENAFVTEINGRRATETQKEYWSMYINGKISLVGAGSYKLKNGDKIEWKIETY